MLIFVAQQSLLAFECGWNVTAFFFMSAARMFLRLETPSCFTLIGSAKIRVSLHFVIILLYIICHMTLWTFLASTSLFTLGLLPFCPSPLYISSTLFHHLLHSLLYTSTQLGSFTGSAQDFAQITDTDKDMASKYGSNEGDTPDSPIHPDNNFFSQVAQPGSTPAIISTACMASLPLLPSWSVSRASSSHTIQDVCESSGPYPAPDKSSSCNKAGSKALSHCQLPSSFMAALSSATAPPLPISSMDWACFVELLGNWEWQLKLYNASFAYKDANPFPPNNAKDVAYYYQNISRINQEVASVHLASGVLGCFITSIGRTNVELQLMLLGEPIPTDMLDTLVESGSKSLSQLLADEHIDLSNIAPSTIPCDIPVTPALHVVELPTVDTPSGCPSSSPLLYIDETSIAQPQPSCPISALTLSSPCADPLHTPTFWPVSSPPVPSTNKAAPQTMDIDPAPPTDPVPDTTDDSVLSAQCHLDQLKQATEDAELLLEQKRLDTQKVVELLVFEQHKADVAKRAAHAATLASSAHKDAGPNYDCFYTSTGTKGFNELMSILGDLWLHHSILLMGCANLLYSSMS